MLLVPVSMFMFLQARSQSAPLVYICFALLPFIKPFFLIPAVLYLFYTFRFLHVLLITLVYLLCFYFSNMLAYILLDFSGSYHSWFANIRYFNSQAISNPIAAYYSYEPLSISYLSDRFFIAPILAHPWLETPHRIIIYGFVSASFCLALYVGTHIVRTGIGLFAIPRIMRDRYLILLFVFLSSSYVFQFFSASIGSYCLSLMTPLLGALFAIVDVSRYRYLCCFLVAISLLPLLPWDIFAFTPKFPTILLFDYLLLLVSRDVRRLSTGYAYPR